MSDDLDLEELPDVGEDDGTDLFDAPNETSEALCDIVIAYRYVGVLRDRALVCMQELAKRREAGDQFSFESYIEQELAKLPKFDLMAPMSGLPNIFPKK